MHKTLQSLCLSLALCLTAALASAAPFVSTRGYTITLPPGWHVNPHHPADDDVDIEFAPQNASEGTPGIGVCITPQGDLHSLEEFDSDMAAEYKRRYPEFVVKSQAYSPIGGVRASCWVLVQHQGSLPVRIQQVDVLKNGLLYTFTAAFLEKKHTKYDPIIARMLASVRWKP